MISLLIARMILYITENVYDFLPNNSQHWTWDKHISAHCFPDEVTDCPCWKCYTYKIVVFFFMYLEKDVARVVSFYRPAAICVQPGRHIQLQHGIFWDQVCLTCFIAIPSVDWIMQSVQRTIIWRWVRDLVNCGTLPLIQAVKPKVANCTHLCYCIFGPVYMKQDSIVCNKIRIALHFRNNF